MEFARATHQLHHHDAGGQSVERLQPDPDATSQRVGNEMVLVHLRTKQVYELNSTAARAWELMLKGADRDQIGNRLRQEFDVEEAVLAAELDALFASLRAAGLVRVRND